MLKIATVCTGIGSPEMALKNLGTPHEIVFGCEIDKYAKETYLANFNPGFMVPDMTKCDWIGAQYYSDLFIGGIPCQSFSLAGKRLGELDPRGLLFFDFLRYVKNQNPKYFIIENVKGLLSDNNGETFRNWIQLLGQSENGNTFMFPHEDSLMYNLHWQVLNTKDYGLPQNRERVFLVGIINDLPNTFVFPKGVPLKLRLKDILEEEVDEKYYLSEKMVNYLSINSKENGGRSLDFTEPGKKEIANCLLAGYYKTPTDGEYLKVKSATKCGYEIATEGDTLEPKIRQRARGYNKGTDLELCPTITINSFQENNHVKYSDYRIRKLTPKECFRLQGFPDEFLQNAIDAGVSNSQLYKQAGNTISVPPIQAILKNLIK